MPDAFSRAHPQWRTAESAFGWYRVIGRRIRGNDPGKSVLLRELECLIHLLKRQIRREFEQDRRIGRNPRQQIVEQLPVLQLAQAGCVR